MPRPSRCRRVCAAPAFERFGPHGIPSDSQVVLSVDEYEALRLIDLEGCTHEQCARRMDISRTTVTEICESARRKVADSLVHGKTLLIEGGNYRFCDGGSSHCAVCPKHNTQMAPPPCKGEETMRIAVTYDNGMIFQHFGHTAFFKLYDVAEGKVVSAEVVNTMGSGHGALAGFLSAAKVDALICGGIGGGAQAALAQAGIRLYGGVSGLADLAVEALLAGNLGYDPNVQCSHHHHEEGHSCGENHHGCAGHDGSCHH